MAAPATGGTAAPQAQQPVTDGRTKIEVVRSAARHPFPTADIDQMLMEIERGYTGG